MDTIEDCPNCDNVGWYVVSNHSAYPWEAEQVQCEWCHTNPNSKYNHEKETTSNKKVSEMDSARETNAEIS